MALSTGCSGCDASGVYATITQVIFNTNWYDDCDGIILENAVRSVKTGTVNETLLLMLITKMALLRLLIMLT